MVREDQGGCSSGFWTALPCGLSRNMGNWHFGCCALLSPGRREQPRTSLRCFPLASALCMGMDDGAHCGVLNTWHSRQYCWQGFALLSTGTHGLQSGKHNPLWHSRGVSTSHLHHRPCCCSPQCKGQSPSVLPPAPLRGAAAFLKKAGLGTARGF